MKRRCGLVLALLATGAALAPLMAAARPAVPASTASATADASGSVALSVRRSSEGVELVVEGTGAAPVLQQSRDGQAWRGDLRIGAPSGLKLGPQRLTLPDAGLQMVSLQGSGSDYAIEVVPVQGAPLARPVVSADGRNLVITFPSGALKPTQRTASPNLQEPGRVPQSAFTPPFQPRAVAPPLGDMAVGTMMLRNRSYLNVSGPPVTLSTRKAQARDVLMSLARAAEYGFAYEESLAGEITSQSSSNEGASPVSQAGSGDSCGVRTQKGFIPCPVTVSFRSEKFVKAFNYVLFTSGLQARLEGNTIFVGPNVLVRSLGNQLSKVYRLNQIGPNQAAEYLANLGAQVTTTNTVATSEAGSYSSKSESKSNASEGRSSYTSTYESGPRTLETYQKTSSFGSGAGPLVGLSVTTDVRLSSITLLGEPSVIAVAENYLRQLDLRQRQVALTVRVLDVNLENSSEIDNSFAFRYGSNFIVNDQGRLLAAFGKNLPAQASSFDQFEETTQSSEYSRSSGGSRNSSSARNSSEGRNSSAGSNATTEASNSAGDTYQLTDTYTTEELRRINDVLQKTSGTVVYKNDVTGKYETLPVPANDGYREATETNISNITNLISAITGRETSASRTNTSSDTRSDGSNSAAGSSSQSGRSSSGQMSKSNAKSKSATSRQRPNPGRNYPDSEFYDFLQAQIVSSSTKVLASPTLILQEGGEPYGGSDAERISADGKIGRSKTNEAFVRVGTQYVTGYSVRQDINGNNFCEPQFGNAGLTFGARVDKIDDNGFVTFSLSPEISAVVGVPQPSGCGNGVFYQINDRLLDTGKIRVRDGQTLILTGVISDEDRSVVTKWPILGDLPLVGQFFRRSSGDRRKSELVIMVTPRVIKDDQGGAYGYGYQPVTNDARSFVYSGG